MTAQLAQPASGGTPRASAGDAGAPVGPYVINLCSSTTPMALSQPNSPELKRFSFFVSRRLEDGRERFRLHMGFFESLADAEEWLAVVREVYPGAWAGETPGKRLRERALAQQAAAAPAPAPSAPAPRPAQATAAPAAKPASSPAAALPEIPKNIPTLHAAPPEASPAPRPQAAAPSAARAAAPARRPGGAPLTQVAPSGLPARRTTPAQTSAAVQPNASAVRSAPQHRGAVASAGAQSAQRRAPPATAHEARPSAPAVRPTPAPTAPVAAPAAAAPETGQALHSRSNVREVLAALDEETGRTRQMPAAQAAAASPAASASTDPSLSDSQVLKILENRRSDGGQAPEDSSIALLRPDDTGTFRALSEAVRSNAPVSFAVQLQWSVQPIDLAKVPPLAIFSAYTLYTVEGSREGRRWFGLRLGFFSDAVSAKQVAHYVRSEFSSVAVVPVSPQERSRATDSEQTAAATRTAAAAVLHQKLPDESGEFKLIDDEPVVAPVPPAPPASAAAKAASAPKAPPPKTPAHKPGAAGSRRVRAKDKRSPQSLEETLEILGADQLQIDNDRGTMLNDTGVRHMKLEVQKNSPFSRLLERLSERSRRNR